MAWIESHQGLPRHRKTKRFARRLGVSIPSAVGHLHLLWWWAMDNLPNGSISELDYEDIADEMMWDGEPQLLISALIESGFIDETENGLFIHDWHDYIGRLLEKRRQDVERKRRNRGRSKGQDEDVQEISEGCPAGQDVEFPQDGARNRTVPNSTVPNQIINTTTTEPNIFLQEEFASLHGKLTMQIKQKEIICMNRLLSSIPLEFIVLSMKQIYKEKTAAGEEITSFLYYEKPIDRLWREQNATKINFGSQKKSNDIDWDALEKRLEERHGHKTGN